MAKSRKRRLAGLKAARTRKRNAAKRSSAARKGARRRVYRRRRNPVRVKRTKGYHARKMSRARKQYSKDPKRVRAGKKAAATRKRRASASRPKRRRATAKRRSPVRRRRRGRLTKARRSAIMKNVWRKRRGQGRYKPIRRRSKRTGRYYKVGRVRTRRGRKYKKARKVRGRYPRWKNPGYLKVRNPELKDMGMAVALAVAGMAASGIIMKKLPATITSKFPVVAGFNTGALIPGIVGFLLMKYGTKKMPKQAKLLAGVSLGLMITSGIAVASRFIPGFSLSGYVTTPMSGYVRSPLGGYVRARGLSGLDERRPRTLGDPVRYRGELPPPGMPSERAVAYTPAMAKPYGLGMPLESRRYNEFDFFGVYDKSTYE